jgi:hypothetical protein
MLGLVNMSYKLSSEEVSSGLSGEDGRNADMELTDVEGLKSGIEVF